MGIIGWIVVGIIAGWLAEKIMKRDDSLVMNLIIGVAGAFVGGGIMSIIGINGTNGWIISIITATVGAVVLLWVIGFVKSKINK